MGTLSPEKSCTNRERVIEVLVQGRDLAAQLEVLVQNPTGNHGSVSAEEVVVKILRSFTEAISELNSCNSGEFCQIPATTQVGSPSCGDLRSVNSGESTKRPAVKDRRGCYKRRKTIDSWMKVLPSMEDGYAWRKYGQKEILNAKFPRCYFRCTHKHDQECRATKQVQRIQEDPIMYQTTYFGHHTCRETLKASQNISDSDPVDSYLVNFESKITAPSIKEESKEEEAPSNDLSSLDSIILPDLMPLESSYSSASTSSHDHGLDMDFLMKSVDLDSYFNFDEAELIF